MKLLIVDKDLVDKTGKAYGGMNQYAAKELGINWKHSEDTIAVSKTANKNETTVHEAIERTVFRNVDGIKYKTAHELTLAIERTIWILITEGYLKVG